MIFQKNASRASADAGSLKKAENKILKKQLFDK
jgi:hypothetical protein